MNEHSFTKSIIGGLPKAIHVQSMTLGSLSMNGTPDRYIDYISDLWVEFKFKLSVGKGVKVDEMLSPLQKRWLKRRWDAGKNACVVVGHQLSGKTQGVLLESPMEWEAPWDRDRFLARSLPRVELINRLIQRVS